MLRGRGCREDWVAQSAATGVSIFSECEPNPRTFPYEPGTRDRARLQKK
ncbi:hypothetical protein GGR27_003833 [Lewinella antarctica]|uniref:Uncharacterized protein n=1 Tax=Neolewinella antarctica TaxID=442734 RepID=A0ABX0XGN9_9BACT|nr:hypothetical protein [Neolewinella antarctica]